MKNIEKYIKKAYLLISFFFFLFFKGDCSSNACDFNNPEIWDGGIAPGMLKRVIFSH